MTKNFQSKIWLPHLIFSNSIKDAHIEFDKLSSVTVRREGTSVPNPTEELFENELYRGMENPLIYKRTYDLDLQCQFQLRVYPFDSQTCFIDVSWPV